MRPRVLHYLIFWVEQPSGWVKQVACDNTPVLWLGNRISASSFFGIWKNSATGGQSTTSQIRSPEFFALLKTTFFVNLRRRMHFCAVLFPCASKTFANLAGRNLIFAKTFDTRQTPEKKQGSPVSWFWCENSGLLIWEWKICFASLYKVLFFQNCWWDSRHLLLPQTLALWRIRRSKYNPFHNFYSNCFWTCTLEYRQPVLMVVESCFPENLLFRLQNSNAFIQCVCNHQNFSTLWFSEEVREFCVIVPLQNILTCRFRIKFF